jgi:WD40 repeat protein
VYDAADFDASPRLLEGNTGAAEQVVFSPDGSLLASSGEYEDGTLRLWDIATGETCAVNGVEPFIHDGGAGLRTTLRLLHPFVPHQRRLFHKLRHLRDAVRVLEPHRLV